jgi:hypothetical protein
MPWSVNYRIDVLWKNILKGLSWYKSTELNSSFDLIKLHRATNRVNLHQITIWTYLLKSRQSKSEMIE